MELFKTDSKINFLGIRKWAAVFSIIITVLSLGVLFTKGLNWGLDFTGGTQIQVQYSKAADLEQMRQQLAQAGFPDVSVQNYGDVQNALIRISPKEDVNQQTLTQNIMQALPGAQLQSSEYIGPVVGQALANNGALALLVSIIATMIYIAFRFEWRFAISAIVALLHDPVLILGIFALFQIEFNLISLAALLTVIGYSLNDTIVIFDRIRENFRRYRINSATEIVNMSVNQTLSRTVITSGLTLLAVLALFLYGGAMLHGFSTALLVGIIIGTYSSIYIAGALAVALGMNKKDLMPPTPKELDDRP